MTSKVEAGSVSARDAALEGWGTPYGGLYTVTSLASTARWRAIDDDPAHGILKAVHVETDGDRHEGPTRGIDVTVEVGEGGAGRSRRLLPVGMSRFGFDMLCRAASIDDGNAFYGAYDPEVAARVGAAVGARKPTRAEEAAIFPEGDRGLDLAVQYDDEAHHAARVLDGLNMVPDDVVAAALLGVSGARLDPDPATAANAEAQGIAALARIAARALLDAPDADAATRRLDLLVEGIRALVADALSAPEGRTEALRVATDAHEDAALARYADERRGNAWKEDLRNWRRQSYETRWYAPLHGPDAPILRDLMERLADDEVKWLVAEPLPLRGDEVVGVVVLRDATALLARGPRGLEPAELPARAGADGTEAVEAFVGDAFGVAPEEWSTRLVGRLVDGLRRDGVATNPILATLVRSERSRHELYEAVRAGGPHDAAIQAEMDEDGAKLARLLWPEADGTEVPASTVGAEGKDGG